MQSCFANLTPCGRGYLYDIQPTVHLEAEADGCQPNIKSNVKPVQQALGATEWTRYNISSSIRCVRHSDDLDD